MAKSFDEPKRPNVVWTDLEGDEGVLCGMVVREIMWRYLCAMKRIDGMGEIPTGSIREPVSRWGSARQDALRL
jgi:hypothetical protein